MQDEPDDPAFEWRRFSKQTKDNRCAKFLQCERRQSFVYVKRLVRVSMRVI